MRFTLSIVLLGLFFAAGSASASGPRVEKKLGLDSTIFTMSVIGKQTPKPGTTFRVKIHVSPGHDWHVYSSKMSSEEGLTPLTLALPPEISDYFSIAGIEETGKLTSKYDSNFMTMTMAHYTPFDIFVTVKVTKKADDEVPFSLLLHFQTCNETMCMPPRTFSIPMTFLGQKPLKLKIAQAVERVRSNSVGFSAKGK